MARTDSPVPLDADDSLLAVRAVGLHKRYALGSETVHALRGVDLSVRRGEFVAVMGASGSGKSTLLHLLGLLEGPDEGSVMIGGVDTGGLDDDGLTELRRRSLGFVFQSFELLPNLTARENALLPADMVGAGAAGRERLVRLAEVLGITDRLDHRPDQLSGGQRQRVALARALINDPVVVLADEPTGNLDSRTGREVLGLLSHGVRTLGWTVVMVTHDPRAAMEAERIIFLRDGTVADTITVSSSDSMSVIEKALAT